ncbi:MAG: hypothetical protein KKI12_02960 [Proteobacteria bacterium]|nr:hypothetical protein [Pseudomonadota bacterium]MBU4258809.1 hypothetical protein [Pseudomonadota bacterium]MBU4287113.1 hypothetical protein [Pseudomonadota bacterium]MCG2757196.1 hypothetical protein [Desulfobacteraceae bacterium]
MGGISFYDPLYDYVTFEEAASGSTRSFFNMGYRDIDAPKQILPFLSTLEVNRLAFLRQSNLSFLIYPSSTHTRFAHAIGCCYLGFLSATKISIIEEHDESSDNETQMILNDWLQGKGLKEEYLLALLLHDVGHFAFSHVMESNICLWAALGFQLKHEDVAKEFLCGEGLAAEAFRNKNASFDNCYNYIADIFSSNSEIDCNVISYLIRGNLDDIKEFDSKKRVELMMLHELTSGLLDLDRIDHYRRDSYFSGLKFASNLNFSIILSGLTIRYNDSGHQIQLSNEAIGHALTLLHSKERLIHDCFENPSNIALEVMLCQAFNLFMFGNRHCESNGKPIMASDEQKKKAIDLLLCTDEELLIRLEAGDPLARQIIYQIRNRDPYTFLGKFIWTKGNIEERTLRKKIINKAGVNMDCLALKIAKGFNGKPNFSKEWLDLEELHDMEGRKLELHPEYSQQIKYFQEAQRNTAKFFWVFTSSNDALVTKKIKKAVADII